MSGAHKAPRKKVREHLARPLLALAAVGIAPPAVIVGPQLVDAPVSRRDVLPEKPKAVAAGDERTAVHTDRWGTRPTSP